VIGMTTHSSLSTRTTCPCSCTPRTVAIVFVVTPSRRPALTRSSPLDGSLDAPITGRRSSVTDAFDARTDPASSSASRCSSSETRARSTSRRRRISSRSFCSSRIRSSSSMMRVAGASHRATIVIGWLTGVNTVAATPPNQPTQSRYRTGVTDVARNSVTVAGMA
jgi:hypothetical protein